MTAQVRPRPGVPATGTAPAPGASSPAAPIPAAPAPSPATPALVDARALCLTVPAHPSATRSLFRRRNTTPAIPDLAIVRNASLTLSAGESLGIVGPSGSGKTSLLMLLAGLERPTSGRVLIDNTDLSTLDEDALARFRGRRIGIVFQSFHLIPTMTALENVSVPLELAGRPDTFAQAELALRRVGLSHRLGHLPGQLSGGEQQRVAIARAIAPEPALLLADEPTGNLDLRTGEGIQDLLFDLQRTLNTALLLITHDQNLAARCDRVLSVSEGQLHST